MRKDGARDATTGARLYDRLPRPRPPTPRPAASFCPSQAARAGYPRGATACSGNPSRGARRRSSSTSPPSTMRRTSTAATTRLSSPPSKSCAHLHRRAPPRPTTVTPPLPQTRGPSAEPTPTAPMLFPWRRRTTRRRGAATFSFAQTLVATGGAALHPFHFRKPTRLALRVSSPALKPATAPWPSRSIVTIGEGKCPHLLNFSKVSGGGRERARFRGLRASFDCRRSLDRCRLSPALRHSEVRPPLV